MPRLRRFEREEVEAWFRSAGLATPPAGSPLNTHVPPSTETTPAMQPRPANHDGMARVCCIRTDAKITYMAVVHGMRTKKTTESSAERVRRTSSEALRMGSSDIAPSSDMPTVPAPKPATAPVKARRGRMPPPGEARDSIPGPAGGDGVLESGRCHGVLLAPRCSALVSMIHGIVHVGSCAAQRAVPLRSTCQHPFARRGATVASSAQIPGTSTQMLERIRSGSRRMTTNASPGAWLHASTVVRWSGTSRSQ